MDINTANVMVRRILLATDFSAVSERACRYAVGLSKRFGAKLTVAHVVDLSVSTVSEEAVVGIPLDEERSRSVDCMKRFMADVSRQGVDVDATTVESHRPSVSLVEIADEIKADAIVMGTSARHGLSKAILGSCAEETVRRAHCPVFVVGAGAKELPLGPVSFHKVVFTTDLEAKASGRAIFALELLRDEGADLYMCHVVESTAGTVTDAWARELQVEAALEQLIPREEYRWYECQYAVESGPVAPRILKFANEVGADLIVLGAKRARLWHANFLTGTVDAVLAGAKCPVLTLCHEAA